MDEREPIRCEGTLTRLDDGRLAIETYGVTVVLRGVADVVTPDGIVTESRIDELRLTTHAYQVIDDGLREDLASMTVPVIIVEP